MDGEGWRGKVNGKEDRKRERNSGSGRGKG